MGIICLIDAYLSSLRYIIHNLICALPCYSLYSLLFSFSLFRFLFSISYLPYFIFLTLLIFFILIITQLKLSVNNISNDSYFYFYNLKTPIPFDTSVSYLFPNRSQRYDTLCNIRLRYPPAAAVLQNTPYRDFSTHPPHIPARRLRYDRIAQWYSTGS